MDENQYKSLLSTLCVCSAGAFAVICVVDSFALIHPLAVPVVLVTYSIAVGWLWWERRVWWWALIPALLGAGFVAFVLLVLLELTITGPPY